MLNLYYNLSTLSTRLGDLRHKYSDRKQQQFNSFYIFRHAATKIFKKAFEKMCKKQNGRAIYLPESMEER